MSFARKYFERQGNKTPMDDLTDILHQHMMKAIDEQFIDAITGGVQPEPLEPLTYDKILGMVNQMRTIPRSSPYDRMRLLQHL